MEVLLGMIFLLQVVVLIQIMHRGNLVLLRMEALEKKMNDKTLQKESVQTIEMTGTVTGNLQPGIQPSQENQRTERTEKMSREALLNEVLSEVFS